MSATVDTTLSQIYTDVGNFIVAMFGLASGQLIQGYPNRTSTPPGTGPWIEMHLARNARLSTNVDTWDETDPAPTTMEQTQSIQLSLQVDIYGPLSGDWATIFSTLWRDDVGCVALADTCQPLYSDDPIRAPLTNAEQQYEDKWIVMAQLQYTPTVSTTQDFANTLDVTLISVDERYPP